MASATLFVPRCTMNRQQASAKPRKLSPKCAACPKVRFTCMWALCLRTSKPHACTALPADHQGFGEHRALACLCRQVCGAAAAATYKITFKTDGREDQTIQCSSDQFILDAVEAAGIDLGVICSAGKLVQLSHAVVQPGLQGHRRPSTASPQQQQPPAI